MPYNARFLSRIVKLDRGYKTRCWLWDQSSRQVFFDGTYVIEARRFAWRLKHGEDPPGQLRRRCDILECVNPAHMRLWKRGERRIPPKRLTLDERLLLYMNKGKPDECWEWKGPLNQKGYGYFEVRTKKTRSRRAAHRCVYEFLVRSVPKDKCCCHRCDNRKCVNPAHIFIGTYRENWLDMVAKGRDNFSRSKPKLPI